MKKIYYFVGIVVSALALASCDSYLDETPDNRTEVDTQDKIAKLLVSAYPSKNYRRFTPRCFPLTSTKTMMSLPSNKTKTPGKPVSIAI